jgi:hypothetical protein
MERNQKCIRNFGGQTSWETTTWKTEKMDNIKKELRQTGCEDRRWMELAQYRVQWRVLVLAVLNIQILISDR